jgi:hypothetical protein
LEDTGARADRASVLDIAGRLQTSTSLEARPQAAGACSLDNQRQIFNDRFSIDLQDRSDAPAGHLREAQFVKIPEIRMQNIVPQLFAGTGVDS